MTLLVDLSDCEDSSPLLHRFSSILHSYQARFKLFCDNCLHKISHHQDSPHYYPSKNLDYYYYIDNFFSVAHQQTVYYYPVFCQIFFFHLQNHHFLFLPKSRPNYLRVPSLVRYFYFHNFGIHSFFHKIPIRIHPDYYNCLRIRPGQNPIDY